MNIWLNPWTHSISSQRISSGKSSLVSPPLRSCAMSVKDHPLRFSGELSYVYSRGGCPRKSSSNEPKLVALPMLFPAQSFLFCLLALSHDCIPSYILQHDARFHRTTPWSHFFQIVFQKQSIHQWSAIQGCKYWS